MGEPSEPVTLEAGTRLALPEQWETLGVSTSGRDELILALSRAEGWDDDVRTVATAVRFNGAFSNHVYRLQLHGGGGKARTYLLRIYGQEGEDSRALVCKQDEISSFVLLAGAGIGPSLVATFANGRVESWIEGRALTNAGMRQCWQPMADALARFHVAATAVARPPDAAAGGGIWSRLRRWLSLLDGCYPEDLPPAFLDLLGGGGGGRTAKAALAAEAAWLEGLLGGVPQDCFCHNDLQHGNIMAVCQEDAQLPQQAHAVGAGGGVDAALPTSQLCFVDYEYSQFGPPHFDLANHFAEWAYDYSCDEDSMADFPGRFPSREQRGAFVSRYLSERARHAAAAAGVPAAPSGEPSEEEAGAFLETTDRFVLLAHLLWVVWGLVQARESSVEGFGYQDYSSRRLHVYVGDKAALLQRDERLRSGEESGGSDGCMGGAAEEGGSRSDPSSA